MADPASTPVTPASPNASPDAAATQIASWTWGVVGLWLFNAAKPYLTHGTVAALAATLAAYVASPSTPAPTPETSLVVAPAFKGKPGQPIELVAQAAGKVNWRSLDAGLTLVTDMPDLIANKKALVFAVKPGKYRVEAWSAVNNAPSAIVPTTVIVSDDEAPKPVPPAPNPPTPTPPVPPQPNPPQPVSPLTAKLQAAYNADPASAKSKAGQLSMLASLYEAMVDHARKPSIVTTGDLVNDLNAVAKQMIAPGALMEVRKAIAAETTAALGTDPSTKIDPDYRPKAVDVFTRVAKSLGEVK